MKMLLHALMMWFALVPAPGLARPAPDTLEGEIIYHIFQRSFRDSNGDGHGDLNGITASLPYLRSLGVTAILLTPLYPSHVYHNYFASRFEGIDPQYGTKEDLQRLIAALHQRGMKVYLDMEFQYLAEDHPWWVAARGDPKSPFADYMLWENRAKGIAEKGPFDLRKIVHFGGPPFGVTTVDLKAAPVKAYFDAYLHDWIDPDHDGKFDDGVDGFRLDHMMDDLDSRGLLTNLFTEFWKPRFDTLRAINPRLTFVGEQFDWDVRKSYGEDYLSRADATAVFAFPIQQAIRKFNKAELVEAIEATARLTPAGKHQLVFAENHDVSRIASDPGITREQLRTAAALVLLLKGTPILYYGQELGMRGISDKGYTTDENAIPLREAFKWSATDAAPGQAIWYRRPGERYWDKRFARDHDGISVEEETRDPRSLLSHYRRLAALRHAHAALLTGSQAILPSAPGLLVIERAAGPERMIVVSNLTGRSATYPDRRIKGGDLISGWAGSALRPWQTALFKVSSR
jgi:alpha-amylase